MSDKKRASKKKLSESTSSLHMTKYYIKQDNNYKKDVTVCFSVFDDDFYKDLQAHADSDLSSMSDADPTALLKSMDVSVKPKCFKCNK